MSKRAEYQIVWSKNHRAYVLQHDPSVFPIDDDALQSWVRLIDAFHFQARSGETLTVRRERKQRGSIYWSAYRRVNGKLHKKYIGDERKVTLALLEATARAFVVSPEPEPAPQPPPPRKPVFQFTRTLASALTIFGFPMVPTKLVLITRYRELVKQHHPDKGGLHQDMVAVNLAYELLKRYVS